MIFTGLMALGLTMIGTGTGIGVRNIYKAGKNAGIKDEAILRKQIATQKEQIKELIDSEFQLNTLIKNTNKSVKETAEAAEWALKLCAETYREFGEKMADESRASEPDAEQVEAKDSAGEAAEDKASDEAEVNLAEAMIELIRNHDVLNDLRSKALDRAKDYSLEVYAAKIRHLIDML